MNKAEIGINWTRRKGLKRFIKDFPKKLDIHFYRDMSDTAQDPTCESLIKFIQTSELQGKEIGLLFHLPKPQKFFRHVVENVQRLKVNGKFSILIKDGKSAGNQAHFQAHIISLKRRFRLNIVRSGEFHEIPTEHRNFEDGSTEQYRL